MEIIKVLEVVKSFFNEYLLPVHKITAIEETEKGWKVAVEIIEENEYMKSHAKDQMIGVYHVQLNKQLEITTFKRQSMRPRSAIPTDG
ncbi:gas vesicle protein GvpO [Alkalihalobacterium chitinilyticum]|uniref:Gas vesicle protein n=1 Tax=Alkalihalobacterium chitinilyticum TaxID=2980103 RepID=A0ABT5VE03_9BACI|nr:gas vesicle protein GvpO [Alkalihalobacterium chitinilyticum]MDE5413664.1 gas vesicle protein [Alkalihalobacterium chitinilyticum]